MKNLFNSSDANEIILRIEKMSPNAQRQWGKMELAQMVAHCGNALEMAIGTILPKRVFIGRVFGPLFRSRYTEEKPFSIGSPTSEEIKVSDVRDFNVEKERLLKLVRQFSSGGDAACTRHPHPFFGKLTTAEWSRGMYKHLDHHLRQFNS